MRANVCARRATEGRDATGEILTAGWLCSLKCQYLDARTAGLATRTVSSASVLRRESLGVTGGVTRPLASVPAGSTLLADSATPALLDTTNIPTASVRTEGEAQLENTG